MASPDLLEVEVATVGVDLNTGASLALLHADWQEVLPIWIGQVEGAPDAEFLSVQGERSIVRLRGMTVSTILDQDRERFSLSDDARGLVVLHADQAVGARGVRRGDVILAIQGEDTRSPSHFLDVVAGTSASSTLEVRVLREGQERRVEVAPRRAPGRVGP